MSPTYKVCTRCVMDTSARDITFDEHGVCNFCAEFLARFDQMSHQPPGLNKAKLESFVAKVKDAGKGRPYDCIVGVSGGVDSSWVLVQAMKLGLRPLAVHMDNGWNSELAQNNISNLVQGLGVDLYTHVVDWHEYRSLMQAFFDADVIDIELLYDNAMLAVNYQQAAKHGIVYIVSGTNQATEGMETPKEWNWFKYDKKNIEALALRFGAIDLNSFPAIGTMNFVWYRYIRRIKWVSILDLMDYNKYEAVAELQRSHGYKPYLYKHSESIFTRFYQGYILPEKFGVDKRRLHLGTLVASGQITRDDALKQLEEIPYSSPEAIEEDRQYFMKKMKWRENQLVEYLARPEKPHSTYGTEIKLWNALSYIYRLRKPRM